MDVEIKRQKPSERYSQENLTKSIPQQCQLPEDALNENTLCDTKELLQQPILINIHVSNKLMKWNHGQEDGSSKRTILTVENSKLYVPLTQSLEFSNVRMVLLDNRQNSEQFCALLPKFSSEIAVLYRAPCCLCASRM